MRSASQLSASSQALAGALLDLALPGVCAGCDQPGGPLCASCEEDLWATLVEGPTRSMPDPVPIHLPPVTARAAYAGVLARLVSAYKDDGRRDLRPVLAGLLTESVVVAAGSRNVVAAGSRNVVLVPMPSSRAARRRRGDDPVADLVRAVADDLGGLFAVAPALRPVRRLADQAGLGHRERAMNLTGAYAVSPRYTGRLEGRDVVLVDDVVTTGVTLAEAARAVRVAGAHVVGAATVAATRRRWGAAAPAGPVR